MHTDDSKSFKAKINLTKSSLKLLTFCDNIIHENGQVKLQCCEHLTSKPTVLLHKSETLPSHAWKETRGGFSAQWAQLN